MRFTRPGALSVTSAAPPKISANVRVARSSRIDADRHSLQLLHLFLRRRVRREHAGANLAARKILETVRHPKRRVDLAVQMRFRMLGAVGRRLMEGEHVR